MTSWRTICVTLLGALTFAACADRSSYSSQSQNEPNLEGAYLTDTRANAVGSKYIPMDYSEIKVTGTDDKNAGVLVEARVLKVDKTNPSSNNPDNLDSIELGTFKKSRHGHSENMEVDTHLTSTSLDQSNPDIKTLSTIKNSERVRLVAIATGKGHDISATYIKGKNYQAERWHMMSEAEAEARRKQVVQAISDFHDLKGALVDMFKGKTWYLQSMDSYQATGSMTTDDCLRNLNQAQQNQQLNPQQTQQRNNTTLRSRVGRQNPPSNPHQNMTAGTGKKCGTIPGWAIGETTDGANGKGSFINLKELTFDADADTNDQAAITINQIQKINATLTFNLEHGSSPIIGIPPKTAASMKKAPGAPTTPTAKPAPTTYPYTLVAELKTSGLDPKQFQDIDDEIRFELGYMDASNPDTAQLIVKKGHGDSYAIFHYGLKQSVKPADPTQGTATAPTLTQQPKTAPPQDQDDQGDDPNMGTMIDPSANADQGQW